MSDAGRRFLIRGVGVTPLLMHWDNIEWSDEMEEWRKKPDNAKMSKPGDDRTPAWTWLGSLYHDGESVVIPQENIMRCITDAGSQLPAGKRGTFKKIVAGGIVPLQEFFTFEGPHGAISVEDVWVVREEPLFRNHAAVVEPLGFRLFVKRARVGMSKHIRVRPRFDQWSFGGEVSVVDDRITEEALQTLVCVAGERMGLGDWRPSAPRSPGPFGKFDAEVKKIS